jgi:mycoredoxin-dependent peroxiredoxin
MSTSASAISAVPQVGDTAPDFTLASTSGQSVTLSSLRGQRVLIAFFPLAFTSTCTAELCDMRDDWDDFTSRDIVVLPISVDSIPTLKEYKQKYGMLVDLLSDFRRAVSRSYGVLLEEKFFANRSYFLIDGEGTIRWEHVEESSSNKRTNAELLAAIDSVTK